MHETIEQHVLTVPVSESEDHIRGARSADVTLLEYGDFECPYCGRAHIVLKELEQEVGDQYRFVFRHFPLTQIHRYAERAAEAAEAADAQGQFWEMHDLLFENQDSLDDAGLQECALALGLDDRQFVEDIANGIHRQRIRQDVIGGVRSGVNGTPTFFINGRRYDGAHDLPSLTQAIAAESHEHHGQGRRR